MRPYGTAADNACLVNIQSPTQRLAVPASPCSPAKARRLNAIEYTSGRLIVNPTAIMPAIDPTPNTAMDNNAVFNS